mmetsp:Transcript_4514/g.13382  ORF Transcript_4514/g.13382 Transcript_4514/m.13382 type:complete len:263 (-) Transcript_4514:276-1064(-)
MHREIPDPRPLGHDVLLLQVSPAPEASDRLLREVGVSPSLLYHVATARGLLPPGSGSRILCPHGSLGPFPSPLGARPRRLGFLHQSLAQSKLKSFQSVGKLSRPIRVHHEHEVTLGVQATRPDGRALPTVPLHLEDLDSILRTHLLRAEPCLDGSLVRAPVIDDDDLVGEAGTFPVPSLDQILQGALQHSRKPLLLVIRRYHNRQALGGRLPPVGQRALLLPLPVVLQLPRPKPPAPHDLRYPCRGNGEDKEVHQRSDRRHR